MSPGPALHVWGVPRRAPRLGGWGGGVVFAGRSQPGRVAEARGHPWHCLRQGVALSRDAEE